MNQRLFEGFLAGEDPVREGRAKTAKDRFGRIQFRAVWRKIERLDTCWPLDLPACVAGRVIEDNAHPLGPGGLAQMVKKELEPIAVHRGAQQTPTAPA